MRQSQAPDDQVGNAMNTGNNASTGCWPADSYQPRKRFPTGACRSLIFCHYAPYAFMLKAPGHRGRDSRAALNLVYHDGVLVFMDDG